MKVKVLMAVLAVMLMASFTGMAYAQGEGAMGANEDFQKKFGAAKAMKFEGTVLSHDVKCHCIVLKTAKGTLTVQDDYAKFMGDYDRAKGLKVGSKATGSYKTVDYINYAVEIQD
jgi:hypothetical protein